MARNKAMRVTSCIVTLVSLPPRHFDIRPLTEGADSTSNTPDRLLRSGSIKNVF